MKIVLQRVSKASVSVEDKITGKIENGYLALLGISDNDDKEKAEKIYMDGVNIPKSYGEAKTFFNQEAHIYYFLGCLYEQQE